MSDEWLSPSVVVSGVGVLATAAAGWITWLNYRMLSSSDRALVKVSFRGRPMVDGTLPVEISVENHSASTWTEMWFELVKPRKVKIASFWGVHTRRNQGSSLYQTYEEAFAALKSTGKVELGGSVMAAGEEGATLFGQRVGPTDKATRWVYLDRSSLRPGQRLSMRVTLLSNDARRRKVTVPIKRTVPTSPITEQS